MREGHGPKFPYALTYYVWYRIIHLVCRSTLHLPPTVDIVHLGHLLFAEASHIAENDDILENRTNIKQVSLFFYNIVEDIVRTDKGVLVHPKWSCARWMEGFFSRPPCVVNVLSLRVIDPLLTITKARILEDAWINFTILTHLNVLIPSDRLCPRPLPLNEIFDGLHTAIANNVQSLQSVVLSSVTSHTLLLLRQLPQLSRMEITIPSDFHVPEYCATHIPGTWPSLQRILMTLKCFYPMRRHLFRTFGGDDFPLLEDFFIDGIQLNEPVSEFLARHDRISRVALLTPTPEAPFADEADFVLPPMPNLINLSLSSCRAAGYIYKPQVTLQMFVLHIDEWADKTSTSLVDELSEFVLSLQTIEAPNVKYLVTAGISADQLDSILSSNVDRTSTGTLVERLKLIDLDLLGDDGVMVVEGNTKL